MTSFLDLNSFFITMQTHVLLSLGGTKRLNSTKPRFPPGGLETRMSHLPWGCCFYRLVAFDPLLPWDLQICLSKDWEKKIWKGKQRGLILSVMQLDSWSLVDIKSCERRTLFYKQGWNVACRGRGLFLQASSCPTFLVNILGKLIQWFSKNGFFHRWWCHGVSCLCLAQVERCDDIFHGEGTDLLRNSNQKSFNPFAGYIWIPYFVLILIPGSPFNQTTYTH